MSGLLALLEAYVTIVGGILVLIGLATLLPVRFWSGGRKIPLSFYFLLMFFGNVAAQLCSFLLGLK